MHELSVVMSILDIAEEEAKARNARKIEEIELEIGKLSGVEIESLNFIWETAVENTILEGAHKYIQHIEGQAWCPNCDQRFIIDQLFDPCPTCGNYFTNLLKGQELRVKSLVIA